MCFYRTLFQNVHFSLTVHTWIAGSLLGPSLGRVLLCVSTILVPVPAFTPIHPIFFWISSYTFSSSRLS